MTPSALFYLLVRVVHVAMAAVAGTTILLGIWLYWRFTGGFDPVVSRSNAGLAFGIGGFAGIIAAVLGGSAVGRGGRTMMELGGMLAAAPEGPERAALMQQISVVQRRTETAARVAVALIGLALVLMSLGHYI